MSVSHITGGQIARGLGGTLANEWQIKRSSDIFELRYGKALVASGRRPGNVPVYGTNGQTGTHDKPLFVGPGVIVGRKGAGHLGVHWCDTDFWVIDTAYTLVPSDGVDLKFAYYLVKYVGLDHLKHGTSNPSLTREAFGAQYLPLPPIEDQRAIAATLSALDDKIESNWRAIAAISGLIDAQSEKYGVELPTVSLGKIATSVKDSVNPSKLGDTIVDHFSLPAFDSGARPERVSASTVMSNKLRVPPRAILLSRLNPRFNRTWWASAEPGVPALASTEFLVLTAEDDLQLAAVWLAVRDPFFREELPKRATGTTGSHQRVGPSDVLSMDVRDFSNAQTETKQSTLTLLERSEGLRAESARLAALRDTLLPELLSGRLRTLAVVP